MFGTLARFSRKLVSNPYGLAAVLITLAAAAGLGYWRRAELSNAVVAASETVRGALGLGVVPAGLWLAAAAIVLGVNPRLMRHFKLWIGAAVFTLSAIGALSFFQPDDGILSAFTTYDSRTLGGALGEAIAGSGTIFQIARVGIVFLIACVIVSPKGAWMVAGWGARGLVYVYVFSAIVGSAVASLASRAFKKRERPTPSAEIPNSQSEPPAEPPKPSEMPEYTPAPPVTAPSPPRSGGVLSRILLGDTELRTGSAGHAEQTEDERSPALAQAAETPALPGHRGSPALAQAAETPALPEHRGSPALAQAPETPALPEHRGSPALAQAPEAKALPEHRGSPALAQAAETPALPEHRASPALAQAAETPALPEHRGSPALAQAPEIPALPEHVGSAALARKVSLMTPPEAASAVIVEDRDDTEPLPAGSTTHALPQGRPERAVSAVTEAFDPEDDVISPPAARNGGLTAISLPQPQPIKRNRFWQDQPDHNGREAQDPILDPGEPDQEAADTAEVIEQPPEMIEQPPEVIEQSPEVIEQSSAETAWDLPSMGLLVDANEGGISHEEMAGTAQTITETLADYGVEVEIGEVSPGPTVTMYGLAPGWVRKYKHVRVTDEDGNPKRDEAGRPIMSRVETRTRVKVGSITSREKDLSLALKTPSLRIETPVMGKALVGIEVPNPRSSLVTLRNLMQTREFKALRGSAKLPIAFGKGSGGETVVVDLAKMPHLLVAGATGSGKSVFINTVVSCLLMERTPEEVRLLLVDPKRVELTPYNGIPHLLTPVVTETDQVVGLLKGLIREMSDRYRRMEDVGVRNISSFNEKTSEKMPYLVVAIDELADLMMTASFDVEQSLCRLAQLGRATGIHLVVATQRPSVDVITGLIKANFPSRVSFGLTSQIDSRTILDSAGAERLLGRGDMLYLAVDAARPERVQGVYISDTEVDDVVNFWRSTPRGPIPPVHLHSVGDAEGEEGQDEDDEDEQRDEMLDKAIELAYTQKKLSTSLLQRKLRIGYPRAARLMDQLEEEGIVGPGDGSKSRDVIIGGA